MHPNNINFDKKTERHNTHSVKYLDSDNLIPLCVADMDFQTNPKIIKNLSNQINNNVYGYTTLNKDFYLSIQKWMRLKYNWDIKLNNIIHSQSILSTLSTIIDTFTNPNDEIIILSPEYHAFYNIIKRNGRVVKECKLEENNLNLKLNIYNLEKTISTQTKMLIFSSPHNPIGRICAYEELKQIGNFCIKNNILIISDEIHADIVYKNKHIPIAKVSNEISNITLTLNSPSKSFNLVGLTLSYIISTNNKLLAKLQNQLQRRLLDKVNICTNQTLITAYNQDDIWLQELIKYLEQNINLVEILLRKSKSEIKFKKPDATYLIWLDFRKINLTHYEIKNKLINEAHVLLCDGNDFGSNYNKFFRLNIATQKAKLKIAVENIIQTFKKGEI